MHIIVNIVFSKNGILNKLYHLKRFEISFKDSEFQNLSLKFVLYSKNFSFFIKESHNKGNMFGPSNPF